MPRTILAERFVDVPKDVKIKVKSRVVTVVGPRGKLTKDFRHLNVAVDMINARKVRVQVWFGKRKALACVRTVSSHIQNLITGVTKGYKYEMHLVFAHFPINVSVENEGKELEIRNFLGEKRVRKVKMLPGVTVERPEDPKQPIVLTGNDVDNVSQSAANIHCKALVRNKDIRKFLDGIYVSSSGVMETEDE